MTGEFGVGFSGQSLRGMRQCFVNLSIRSAVRSELIRTHYRRKWDAGIGHTLCDQLARSYYQHPDATGKAGRLFQAYVAMTRPTHLLCLAMRGSSLGTGGTLAANQEKLEARGWRIHPIAAT